MSSEAFKQAVAVWAALVEHADQPVELMSTAQHLEQLQRIETLSRILPALRHEHITELNEHATAEELAGSLRNTLAERLRIRGTEATRRIAGAADLGPRQTLTGQPLPPKLAATAAGQAAGLIDAEHLTVIRSFFAQLPHFIDEAAKEKAEHDLATVASAYRPDELHRFADWYETVLNPDGNYTDDDRARRRGISIGPQGPDGMSRLSGHLDPELRAGLDAVLATWAAPGMCNPYLLAPREDAARRRQRRRRTRVLLNVISG